MLSVWAVLEALVAVVVVEGASGEDCEGVAGAEEGGVGLRMAVKSTADDERCIRARKHSVPQRDRLSWGESGTTDEGASRRTRERIGVD